MGKSHTNFGKLFIISAPTGAGKTTLTNLIIARHPHVRRAITYTTRKPRPGETHGVDYFFVSEPEFLILEDKNFFLETTKYDQSWYGSPKDILDDVETGAYYIIITDWPGAQTISHELRTHHAEIPFHTIWITVTSGAVLSDRLKTRYSHDLNALERRLKLFTEEIKREEEAQFFDYHVINDKLEETYGKLCSIMELSTKEQAMKNKSLLLIMLVVFSVAQSPTFTASLSVHSDKTEEEKAAHRAAEKRREEIDARRNKLAGPNRQKGSGEYSEKGSVTGKGVVNAIKAFFSGLFYKSKNTKQPAA